MAWRQYIVTRLIGGWALQNNLSEPDLAGVETGAAAVVIAFIDSGLSPSGSSRFEIEAIQILVITKNCFPQQLGNPFSQ
jgi:hypothetical protein